MKKKATLNDLRVQSFITNVSSRALRGGEKTKGFCQSVDNICASNGADECTVDAC
ncbi:pinensin family lanthipeptide [Roseivirga sp. BDSF3-8]|uniref:pinensin family lanthipeptide n=1 Tax=Roseivirga sp. BDSF3-8 TaxID=3241598 RepID=UPI0035320AA7